MADTKPPFDYVTALELERKSRYRKIGTFQYVSDSQLLPNMQVQNPCPKKKKNKDPNPSAKEQ
jgi:hypothetical protein